MDKYKTYFIEHIMGMDVPSILANEYSRFKYGSKSIARKFGKSIGEMLTQMLTENKQYVVVPAPYNFIPTATYALKDYVIATMNRKAADRGFKPVQEAKIFRPASYNADYGNMTLDERREAIGSEKFHVDVEFLKGKTVLFLDDIRVTGAHEERIIEMIQRLQPDCECIFVYFARVIGEVDPKVENHLNYYAMKSLLDLDKIIKNDEFIFNTRNIKFILSAPAEEFRNFIQYQKRIFSETLYSDLIGNGYHLEPDFATNVNYLKTLIKTN